MEIVIVYSIIAGVVGTGLGGIIGVVFGKQNNNLVGAVLGFSSGVMLAVVFFDLVPEAIYICEQNMVVLLGFIWGIVIMLYLNKMVNHFSNKVKVKINILQASNNIVDYKKLKFAGLFLMMAIAIHNIPEGMAIGASGVVDDRLGLSMATVICLHDIPEGIAVSLPLCMGKVGKIKAVLLTLVSGLMTVVGCVLGIVVGGISNVMTAFFLSFAGGTMLQVTMCEMIPDALNLSDKNKVFYFILIGVIVGLLAKLFV